MLRLRALVGQRVTSKRSWSVWDRYEGVSGRSGRAIYPSSGHCIAIIASQWFLYQSGPPNIWSLVSLPDLKTGPTTKYYWQNFALGFSTCSFSWLHCVTNYSTVFSLQNDPRRHFHTLCVWAPKELLKSFFQGPKVSLSKLALIKLHNSGSFWDIQTHGLLFWCNCSKSKLFQISFKTYLL